MAQKQCKLKLPSGDAVHEATAIKARLEQGLDEAEEKAHRNLARCKFNNFGYWAVVWVHLNRIGQFHRPNPFSDYVKLARKKGGVNDTEAEPN